MSTKKGTAPKVVRSDASTLHVDFEKVTDTLICARNAGVIINFMTKAKILDNFGYDGKRCAHIAVKSPEEQTRLRILRAYDAPQARDNTVIEFVYRPVIEKASSLKNWPIVKCFTKGGAPGVFELNFLNDPVYGMEGVLDENNPDIPKPVALELRANSQVSKGTYSIDIVDGDGRKNNVVTGAPQTAWTRFIMHRHKGMVDLFAGTPDEEKFIGTFRDIRPDGELYSMTIGNPEEPKVRGCGYWDCFRVGRPLKKTGKLSPPEERIKHVGEFVPQPPRRLKLGKEKHLFIDDWSVAETRNIQFRFHRPEKHPKNPLIICDKAWEMSLIICQAVERMKDGKLRMWYYSGDAQPENRKRSYGCIAMSKDGINWEKPSLGIHEHNGSKKNNISCPDAAIGVITDADDPRPDFRYVGKMRHQGTQGASSPDGIHWTNRGVIIPQSLDASSTHWDPVRKKYVASIKLGYKNRRYRGYAESDDFLNWTDTYLMSDIDELDVKGDNVYSMSMFRYESLYLGLCKIYHVRTSDTCDVHLTVSHNCMHWERPFRAIGGPKFDTKENDVISYPDPHTQPFIPTGPPGSWEYGNSDQAYTAPVRDGNRLLFYYTGRPVNHSGKHPDNCPRYKGKGGSIGLATLRLDGFVSANADASGGFIITKPITLDGNSLYVNANAAKGHLKVEILDSRMKPLPGFELSNARAIKSDKVRLKCQWKNIKNIPDLAGKTVRLKFHLDSARLFAFWSE
jgi:hypothetical protein